MVLKLGGYDPLNSTERRNMVRGGGAANALKEKHQPLLETLVMRGPRGRSDRSAFPLYEEKHALAR